MTWAIDQELQVKEKMVLVVLAHYLNNKTGQCNPSLVRLAKDSGMSKDSVIRAIKILEGKKLITPIRKKVGEINVSNQYKLLISSSTQRLGVVANSDNGSSTQRLGVVADSDNGSSCVLPEQGIEQGNKNKEVEQGKKDAPKFQKPSPEEISAFCVESGISIDIQRFIDYYESNGWRVGRNPMKNWQATVRNWAKNDKTFKQPATSYSKQPAKPVSEYRYVPTSTPREFDNAIDSYVINGSEENDTKRLS
jgi:hypothetical protein